MAKRFSWKKTSRKKSASLRDSETISESKTMGCEKKIRKRMEKYNDELKTRQESIGLRKDRSTNQITSFKQAITTVLV